MSAMESLCNDQQWPTLASSTVASERAKQKVSDATAMATTANDWEILDDAHDADPMATTPTPNDTSSSGFVVVDDDDEDEDEDNQEVSRSYVANRKLLKHSVSSPILSGRTGGAISDIGQATMHPPANEPEDADDSFSLVSDVASIWTATSTTVAKSTMTVSFRDAILLSSPNTEPMTTSYRTVAAACAIPDAATGTTNLLRSSQHHPRQRSRIQPKFVVVQSPSKPIRRCSKSTGDLLQLTISEEFDVSHSSDIAASTSSGRTCTDEMYEDEVYYHKAMGATARVNGLKMRPDEAQRKQMILNKKNHQRQLSAMNGKSRTTATEKAR